MGRPPPDPAYHTGSDNGLDSQPVRPHRHFLGGKALQQKHGTLPAILEAPAVTIQALPSVESGSLLASDGWGGTGATFDDATALGGATKDFGGSHGGYGGIPIDATSQDAYQTLGGRGPVFDNPFDPQQPGNGGGGSPGNASGLAGGGLIRATFGEFTVNGTIEANGDGAGRCGICGDHGGGGGGGTLNPTGRCVGPNRHHCRRRRRVLCQMRERGRRPGGGGRIAVHFTTGTFQGGIHAWGRSDVKYPKNRFDLPVLDGRGGAGTVFLQPKGQKAPYPGGTLIVDGGGGGYPNTDGTPLPAGWSAANRELIVRNGARVYATTSTSVTSRPRAVELSRHRSVRRDCP